MQNTRTLAKAGAATAAIASVAIAGLASAPAASAAPKMVSKSGVAKAVKISMVGDKSVTKGKKVRVSAGKVTVAKGFKVKSIKISVKKTGKKYGWAAKGVKSYNVGAGRWSVRTDVQYVSTKNPKQIKKAHLTNRFTVKAKAKATPAAKISSSRAAMWNRVAKCESGGNWKINTGNGYYGGLQFNPRTWLSFGGGKYASSAHRASKAEQITIAEKVLKGQGAGAWGSCGRKAGLRR